MIYSKFEEIGRATFKWKVTLPNIAYPEHAKVTFKINLVLKNDLFSLKLVDGALPQFRSSHQIVTYNRNWGNLPPKNSRLILSFLRLIFFRIDFCLLVGCLQSVLRIWTSLTWIDSLTLAHFCYNPNCPEKLLASKMVKSDPKIPFRNFIKVQSKYQILFVNFRLQGSISPTF